MRSEETGSLGCRKLLRMLSHRRWDTGTIITSRDLATALRDENMTKRMAINSSTLRDALPHHLLLTLMGDYVYIGKEPTRLNFSCHSDTPIRVKLLSKKKKKKDVFKETAFVAMQSRVALLESRKIFVFKSILTYWDRMVHQVSLVSQEKKKKKKKNKKHPLK